MELVEKEAFIVIGMRVEADWQQLHTKMPGAWKAVKERMTEIKDRKEDIMMDLSLDVTDGLYTQLIGVEVEESAEVPEGMEKVEIPARKYIHYKHHGMLTEIAQSFGKMYDWAKHQELTAGEFKIDYGYTVRGDEQTHDLYIRLME